MTVPCRSWEIQIGTRSGSQRVRLTRSVPASKSTSSHFRPSSSPSLKPQCMASVYKASNLSPQAVARNARACSGERGLISFFFGFGALMPSAILRGISPSDTASCRALRSVRWMYCTVLGLEPLSSFSRYRPRTWVGVRPLSLMPPKPPTALDRGYGVYSQHGVN